MPAWLLPTWHRLNAVVSKANYGVWLWIRPSAACFVSAVVGQAAAAAAAVCVHCLDTLPELISLFLWLRTTPDAFSGSVHPPGRRCVVKLVPVASVRCCLRLQPDQGPLTESQLKVPQQLSHRPTFQQRRVDLTANSVHHEAFIRKF